MRDRKPASEQPGTTAGDRSAPPVLERVRRRAPAILDGGPWRFRLAPDVDLPGAVTGWRLLYEGAHSRIYRLEAAALVVKLAEPRSRPRDDLRKYVMCQARREYRGAAFLNALGLDTPDMRGWAVSLAPGAHYESALFMRPLPPFVSGLRLLRSESDADRRAAFLARLASELGTLFGHGFVHKDCHFDNLCVRDDGRLVWIDCDIRRPGSAARRRQGLRRALALLRRTARNDIGEREWRIFKQQFGEALAHAPNGPSLIDEIQ